MPQLCHFGPIYATCTEGGVFFFIASKVLSEKKNSSPLTTTSMIQNAKAAKQLSKLMIRGTNHWSIVESSVTTQTTCTPKDPPAFLHTKKKKETEEPLRSVLRCDMQRQVQGW